MPKLKPVAFAALAAIALAGCNATTAIPYPVTAGPNPAPPRGYRVECTSTPAIAYPFFRQFHTGCRQILPPTGPDRVIRARG